MGASERRVEADCVAVYRDIRAGVPADAAQIGYGYNLYPCAPAVTAHLTDILATLVTTGRLGEYSTAADSRERDLFADLAARHLGLQDLTGEHVVFTHGATESIAVTVSYLAACGAELYLPLPGYYAFEHAACRAGCVVAGRYRHDGVLHPASQNTQHPAATCALVIVIPNGVTGTPFRTPAAAANPDFTVFDLVFQANGKRRSDPARAAREAITVTGLSNGAVLMTASKDLSLPGVRAGALLSQDSGLLAHARAHQFSHYAVPAPLGAQLMLTYLATLIICETGPPGTSAFGRTYQQIAGRYAAHRVAPIPGLHALEETAAHLEAMNRHFQTVLELARHDGHGLLDLDHVPAGGYSCLPRLQTPVTGMDQFVAWVNACGRTHRLKLNPTPLFGGTTTAWTALYPDIARIRLNISVPTSQLRRNLGILRAAAEAGVQPASPMTGSTSRPMIGEPTDAAYPCPVT